MKERNSHSSIVKRDFSSRICKDWGSPFFDSKLSPKCLM